MKPRWLLEAIGASLLLLLPYFCPLMMPDHLIFYHHHLPLINLIGGLLLDVLGLFLLGVVLLLSLTRLSSMPRKIVGASFAGFFIFRIVGVTLVLLTPYIGQQFDRRSLVQHHHFIVESTMNWWLSHSHAIIATGVALLTVLAWKRPGSTDFIVRTMRLGLTAFAFCAVWMIPQLLYMGFAVPGVPTFDHSSPQADSAFNKRIVWILFDELSYNLTFDQALSGQQFANFQRLRSQSTSLGNIKPVGAFTESIIPSLLAGREIDQIKSTTDGKLLNLDSDLTQEVAFDPNRTLLGEAKTNGWNPGVAGWYNPYCRIFAAVLTNCSWVAGIQTMLPFEQMGASEDRSILANSMVLPRALLAKFHSQKKSLSSELLNRNIQDFRGVMTQSRNLIQNGQIHFVFIHLPVPHPPGIYNRRTHQLSEGGNYLDNLTLADDTLGVLMQEIARTPSANETTVIISSDHSWRVPIWRTGRDWTQEEERVSLGQFDERPVFLVHFPGQKSGNEVTTPTPELIEYGIVDAMLKDQINSPRNLDAFLLSSARQNSEHAALRGQSDARY